MIKMGFIQDFSLLIRMGVVEEGRKHFNVWKIHVTIFRTER